MQRPSTWWSHSNKKQTITKSQENSDLLDLQLALTTPGLTHLSWHVQLVPLEVELQPGSCHWAERLPLEVKTTSKKKCQLSRFKVRKYHVGGPIVSRRLKQKGFHKKKKLKHGKSYCTHVPPKKKRSSLACVQNPTERHSIDHPSHFFLGAGFAGWAGTAARETWDIQLDHLETWPWVKRKIPTGRCWEHLSFYQ